jgi:hypothetical protein
MLWASQRIAERQTMMGAGRKHIAFTRAIRALTRDQFLVAANNNARSRTFDASVYEQYIEALYKARKAAKKSFPFYAAGNAGGIDTTRKTDTAQWAVWVDPYTHVVIHAVLRVAIHGHHVPNPWLGGKEAYESLWWHLHAPQIIKKESTHDA